MTVRIEESLFSNPEPQGFKSRYLREKAAEFEGMLIAQVLQKLDECYRLDSEEADSANQGFTSLATSALGGGLARSGGLGLGEMLVQSLQKAGARSPE
jgi:Rod binding domain-containing protein